MRLNFYNPAELWKRSKIVLFELMTLAENKRSEV
jgi:hypothetical protein